MGAREGLRSHLKKRGSGDPWEDYQDGSDHDMKMHAFNVGIHGKAMMMILILHHVDDDVFEKRRKKEKS